MDAQNYSNEIRAGLRHAQAVLDVRAAEYGGDAAIALAAGIMTGLRDWLVTHHGKETAAIIISQLADDTLAPPNNVVSLITATGRAN